MVIRAPFGVLKVGDRFFWNLSFFDIGGSDLGIEGLATGGPFLDVLML